MFGSAHTSSKTFPVSQTTARIQDAKPASQRKYSPAVLVTQSTVSSIFYGLIAAAITFFIAAHVFNWLSETEDMPSSGLTSDEDLNSTGEINNLSAVEQGTVMAASVILAYLLEYIVRLFDYGLSRWVIEAQMHAENESDLSIQSEEGQSRAKERDRDIEVRESVTNLKHDSTKEPLLDDHSEAARKEMARRLLDLGYSDMGAFIAKVVGFRDARPIKFNLLEGSIGAANMTINAAMVYGFARYIAVPAGYDPVSPAFIKTFLSLLLGKTVSDFGGHLSLFLVEPLIRGIVDLPRRTARACCKKSEEEIPLSSIEGEDELYDIVAPYGLSRDGAFAGQIFLRERNALIEREENPPKNTRLVLPWYEQVLGMIRPFPYPERVLRTCGSSLLEIETVTYMQDAEGKSLYRTNPFPSFLRYLLSHLPLNAAAIFTSYFVAPIFSGYLQPDDELLVGYDEFVSNGIKMPGIYLLLIPAFRMFLSWLQDWIYLPDNQRIMDILANVYVARDNLVKERSGLLIANGEIDNFEEALVLKRLPSNNIVFREKVVEQLVQAGVNETTAKVYVGFLDPWNIIPGEMIGVPVELILKELVVAMAGFGAYAGMHNLPGIYQMMVYTAVAVVCPALTERIWDQVVPRAVPRSNDAALKKAPLSKYLKALLDHSTLYNEAYTLRHPDQRDGNEIVVINDDSFAQPGQRQ